VKKQHQDSWEGFLSASDLQELRKVRDEANEAMMAADDDVTRRPEAKQKKIKLELLTTALMRNALEAETKKLSTSADSHGDAWKVLSKLRGGPAQCPIPTEKLVQHFSSIAKPSEAPLLPRPLQPNPTGDASSDNVEPLTPGELESALLRVNKSSAAGPDGLSPWWMCRTFCEGERSSSSLTSWYLISFLRSLRRHDFKFVREAETIDAQFLLSNPTALHSNIVRLIKRFEPRFSPLSDNICVSCDRILANTDSDRFIYHFIRHGDSDTLSFFREIGCPAALTSFRSLLQSLPNAQMRILILFCASLLRFRFCTQPTALCPLCGRAWTWEHFFTCRFLDVVPCQSSSRVLLSVKRLIREGSWDILLDYVHFYLLQWRALTSNPAFSCEDLEGLTMPVVTSP
jgi:hypothetical protein